eukprot:gene4049-5791_t
MDQTTVSKSSISGVIIPPPDIRAVIDKTAQFVARNGKSFEQRILNSGEGKTAKFDFMKQVNPYNAYYELKIREFEEGKSDNNENQQTQPTQPQTSGTEEMKSFDKDKIKKNEKFIVSTSVKASIANPIAILIKNSKNNENAESKGPPPPLEFSMGHPSGINPMDSDIIKLTAQYTAVNGREFLASLAQKEQRNPQFDFLKPTHMLFSYFTSLVDAYAKILHPSADQISSIISTKQNNAHQKVLELTVNRWIYLRTEEEKKNKESHEANEERLAFQAIDWFDFTVVEVIDFPDDELLEIPGMESLGVNSTYDDRTNNISSKQSNLNPSVNSNNSYNNSRINSIPMPPPPPVAPASYFAPHSLDINHNTTNEMEAFDDNGNNGNFDSHYNDEFDNDEVDFKVVSNYQPRIAGSANSENTKVMVDPISGKVIPVDQMEEHMRVQLLDPKWRLEQKRFQEKQKETGLAANNSIADSLKMFAKKRGDIFGQAAVGSDANSALAIAEETARENKNNEIASQVQWDGHYSSINTTQAMKAELVKTNPYPAANTTSQSSLASTIGPTTTSYTALPIHQSTHMSLPPPPPVMNQNQPINMNMSIASGMPQFSDQGSFGMMAQNPPLPPSYGGFAQLAQPLSLPTMPMQPPMNLMSMPMFMDQSNQAQMQGQNDNLGNSQAQMDPNLYQFNSVFNSNLAQILPTLASNSNDVGYVDQSLPASKKQKQSVDNTQFLVSAEEFMKLNQDPISLNISLPVDNTVATWNLNGQLLVIPNLSLQSSIKELKDILSEQYLGSMPSSKQQLKSSSLGFLKDTSSLAALNLLNGSILELTLKSRGGKR